jgi:hypothetical protein
MANLCKDCGTDTTPRTGPLAGSWEWYKVHDAVWAAAGMPENGFLCIGCLERRLGRELTPEDFPDLPVNDPARSRWWVQDTARLASRKVRKHTNKHTK